MLTSEGQIKKGDWLRIEGKNPRDSQYVTAKDVIQVNGNEEVILHKKKNRYFITKLYLEGKSWAKNIHICDPFCSGKTGWCIHCEIPFGDCNCAETDT